MAQNRTTTAASRVYPTGRVQQHRGVLLLMMTLMPSPGGRARPRLGRCPDDEEVWLLGITRLRRRPHGQTQRLSHRGGGDMEQRRCLITSQGGGDTKQRRCLSPEGGGDTKQRRRLITSQGGGDTKERQRRISPEGGGDTKQRPHRLRRDQQITAPVTWQQPQRIFKGCAG